MRVVCEYHVASRIQSRQCGDVGFCRPKDQSNKRRRVLVHRSIRPMSAEIPWRPDLLWSIGSCTSEDLDLYSSWFKHLSHRESYPYHRALAENSVHLELSAMGGHDAGHDW